MPTTKDKAAKPTGRTAARAAGDTLEAERQGRIAERDAPETAPANLQVVDLDGSTVAVYDPDATQVWKRLTAPFPQDHLEKLPRNLKKNDDNKGRCEAGSYYSAD